MNLADLRKAHQRRAELLSELAAVNRKIAVENEEAVGPIVRAPQLRRFAQQNGYSDATASRVITVLNGDPLHAVLTKLDPDLRYPKGEMPLDLVSLMAVAAHMKPGIVSAYGAITDQLLQSWVDSLVK